jgi:cobalt-precorrin-5B (C1)-methyltransferase
VRFLKYGISTGACAAAAAKAALLALLDRPVKYVVIPTPIGLRLEVAVKECRKISTERAMACVIKDAGDDVMDVTNGIEICAIVRLLEGPSIIVKGGKGVGVVTKPGLPVPVGEAAINPVPRMMIEEAVKEVLPPGKGVEVVIEVPRGAEIAEKTWNPKLGIVGGISILGTIGIVKPYSLRAYKRSLVSQIDVALASGHRRLFLVPGNIGARIARDLFKAPEDAIIQTGDFVGYMLEKCVERGVSDVVLLGHAGKLVKLAAGVFNTHHKVADVRMEVIAAYAALVGASPSLVEKILRCNTTEEAMTLLKDAGLLRQTFTKIAERIRHRCIEKVKGKAEVTVIIVSQNGEVLGQAGS